jgi:RNase P/RNase MRP subunit p29
MNLIGERVKLLDSHDETKKGITGKILLETANTFLLDSGPRTLTVEKAGSVFMVQSSGTVLSGNDLAGRLEDRWGGRRR